MNMCCKYSFYAFEFDAGERLTDGVSVGIRKRIHSSGRRATALGADSI